MPVLSVMIFILISGLAELARDETHSHTLNYGAAGTRAANLCVWVCRDERRLNFYCLSSSALPVIRLVGLVFWGVIVVAHS